MSDQTQDSRGTTVDHAEALRQLVAACEGRFRERPSGRYEIVGERRPDRKTREWLARQGWIEWHSRWAREGYTGWRLTPDGADVLPQFKAEVDGA